ncbi:MAG: hypothetical protein LAP85_29765 [Acidobacteriia bacterium]|nr:hypothetical protein [Terriglobia bacterium]
MQKPAFWTNGVTGNYSPDCPSPDLGRYAAIAVAHMAVKSATRKLAYEPETELEKWWFQARAMFAEAFLKN